MHFVNFPPCQILNYWLIVAPIHLHKTSVHNVISYRLFIVRLNTSLALFINSIEAYEINYISAQFPGGVYVLYRVELVSRRSHILPG